jgi:hypothetical protein
MDTEERENVLYDLQEKVERYEEQLRELIYLGREIINDSNRVGGAMSRPSSAFELYLHNRLKSFQREEEMFKISELQEGIEEELYSRAED